MRIRHPEALEGVGGQCPDRVGLGGDAFDCGDGAAFDVPRACAEALAARYGVDVERITVEQENSESDDSGGVCGAEMSDGTTCERPADECPYH